MPVFCSCASTIANTGYPNKQNIIGVGTILVAVPYKSDSGIINHIAQGDTIDDAYISAKINNVDPSQRWYPIGTFNNVNDVREAPNFEEFDDGTRQVTRLGRRTYTGLLLGFSSRYLAKLESLFCQKFGLFMVDDCGNLIGSISADGTKLYPVRVNESSWVAQLVKETPTQGGRLSLEFDFARTEKDKDLRMISFNEITADLTVLEGLRDVTAVTSAPAVDEVTVALTLPFDEFLNSAPPATGWTTATDWDLYNVTTASSVTVTSVTESPTGTYNLAYAVQTSADVMRLRPGTTKKGMWFEVTFNIP